MKNNYLFRALALLSLLTCAAGVSAENVDFSYQGMYYRRPPTVMEPEWSVSKTMVHSTPIPVL